MMAWASDTNGRRQYTLRVKNLQTGEILPEAIPGIEFVVPDATYLMFLDFSGTRLATELGVDRPAAWLLKHKLMQAMVEREGRRQLAGWVQLDDAYFGGERRGGEQNEERTDP